jgi:hypothetical protein
VTHMVGMNQGHRVQDFLDDVIQVPPSLSTPLSRPLSTLLPEPQSPPDLVPTSACIHSVSSRVLAVDHFTPSRQPVREHGGWGGVAAVDRPRGAGRRPPPLRPAPSLPSTTSPLTTSSSPPTAGPGELEARVPAPGEERLSEDGQRALRRPAGRQHGPQNRQHRR